MHCKIVDSIENPQSKYKTLFIFTLSLFNNSQESATNDVSEGMLTLDFEIIAIAR